MPSYKPPWKTSSFLLNDVFQIDRYDNLSGFSDASARCAGGDFGRGGGKLARKCCSRSNRIGDLEGCTRHDDGSVATPKGFKEAFRQVADGGWLSLRRRRNMAEQGLPVTLSQAVNELPVSADMSSSMMAG